MIRNSYICISRIALENKAAAEGPPPKKRRRMNEGSQAKDMSLVTSANVNDREGWKVSSLGRITRPVKMRPERPLPEIQEEKLNPALVKKQVRDVGTTEGEKNKNKRLKDPDSRARRRTIDMTKWGSVHLKGMFLDMPALGMKRLKLDDAYDPTIESEGNEESRSLNLLASMFGGNDDNWVHPKSVGSDIDVGEFMKGDARLVDDDEDDGIEVAPVDSSTAGTAKLQDEEEEENEQETENPLVPVTSTKSTELGVQASTKLKDLFAPREEEGKCFQVYCN